MVATIVILSALYKFVLGTCSINPSDLIKKSKLFVAVLAALVNPIVTIIQIRDHKSMPNL